MQNIIIVHDECPMFADVLSGSSPSPVEFEPSPAGTDWREQRVWWHWAIRTHAGRAALRHVGCPINPSRNAGDPHDWQPGDMEANGWRVQPWADYGAAADHPLDQQFGNAVGRLREALGVPLAGVFYGERRIFNSLTGEYQRSSPFMVALNEDGTRAAVAQLSYAR